MSEKPTKRLVGWKHYLGMVFKKGGLYSGAIAVGSSALVFLAGSLVIPVMGPDSDAAHFHPDEPALICLLFLSGLSGALFLGAMWATTTLFRRAKEIEFGVPITRHNTGHLPEVETLVRASDVPSFQQRAELLRAAQYDKEAPVEQLLRVGPERG